MRRKLKAWGLFIGMSVAVLSTARDEQLIAHKQLGKTQTKEVTETSIGCKESQDMNTTGTVLKTILENGLTVLVKPVHTLPEVSCFLWYGAGSRNEEDGTRGFAHALEHMIFKGTAGKQSLKLSESDINVLTHKLSGSCNAFTHYDYTGYRFNFPAQNWEHALPIMADCMRNCALKDDHLNSEMKAVIQELKMRRDNDRLSLLKALLEVIFVGHPYHYPIIGYKKDLLAISSQALQTFYKEHYVPNNATLVVVGDVDPDRVVHLAKHYFGSLVPNKHYTRKREFLEKDIEAKSVTLYRDIQQPFVSLCWVVPGLRDKTTAACDIASLLLGEGRGSRLYRTIVDQKQLATSLTTFTIDLFDYSLFCVAFNPVNIHHADAIATLVNEEIAAVVHGNVTHEELNRAINKAQMRKYGVLESIEEQAHEIGYYYLATGDSEYAFTYLEKDPALLLESARKLLADHCRPTLMHKGMVLPLPASEVAHWQEQQRASDVEDERILSTRVRTTPVEKPSYADTIQPGPTKIFSFPKPTIAMLSNGAKVLSYHNANVPKIDLVIDLRVKHYYDPEELPGLGTFVAAMLDEGTQNYTAEQLADELESRGMSFGAYPGMISLSMLSKDFVKGLELLEEILTKAIFDPEHIEKVRIQLLTELKIFWDNPSKFARQIVHEHMYKGHPYSKNSLGTPESIAKITREDLVGYYKKFVSPAGAKIAIVGDLQGYNVHDLLQAKLSSWQGSQVPEMVFPSIMPTKSAEILYPINRDQVVLCLAGLSIDRRDPDFDNLSVFDQIFGGGELSSMSSRLFDLREASGLFYTIGGTFIHRADEQPGMLLVRTIVSLDRLQEAEKAIGQVVKTAADDISDEELTDAKNAIIHSLINKFESNAGIAGAFLFIERYGFAPDYFDMRAALLEQVTRESIRQAVKRVLSNGELTTFKIGRVGQIR